MNKKLLIFGTGEIAELAYYYFMHDSNWDVSGFVCDDVYYKSTELLGLPCFRMSTLNTFSPDKYAVHIALSYRHLNKIRKDKYLQIKKMGYETPSYISSKATVWSGDIGENCFILEDQTIQPNVKIGNNVVLWSGNHIGHGTRIADHVYIASQVVLSGNCTVGERTFIGVNATIKDFTNIGENCFITMGSNITNDCPKGSVVLAPKSTLLKEESPAAIKIKNNYFEEF